MRLPTFNVESSPPLDREKNCSRVGHRLIYCHVKGRRLSMSNHSACAEYRTLPTFITIPCLKIFDRRCIISKRGTSAHSCSEGCTTNSGFFVSPFSDTGSECLDWLVVDVVILGNHHVSLSMASRRPFRPIIVVLLMLSLGPNIYIYIYSPMGATTFLSHQQQQRTGCTAKTASSWSYLFTVNGFRSRYTPCHKYYRDGPTSA